MWQVPGGATRDWNLREPARSLAVWSSESFLTHPIRANLERTRETSERNEQKRAPQQQRTATRQRMSHPLDHRTPPGAVWARDTAILKRRPIWGTCQQRSRAGPQRAARNPAARRTSRGRCANDLFLVAESIVIDHQDHQAACRGDAPSHHCYNYCRWL